MTRRQALCGLGALVASACVGPGRPPGAATLGEIVRRNTKARGGAAALDRVRSIAVDVEISEGGLILTGRYAADVAGRVRIDVYADGKLVGGEGVDGAGVWILGPHGPRPSIATGAANALVHGAQNHLFGWHRFDRLGHRLALMPAATIDGTTYPVIRIRYSTGHVSYFHVDPVTWQAVRRLDERAYHPDLSMTKQQVESRFEDFQSVDGVVAPHRNEDYEIQSGKLLAVHRVLKRSINPALPADHFDRNRPAAATW